MKEFVKGKRGKYSCSLGRCKCGATMATMATLENHFSSPPPSSHASIIGPDLFPIAFAIILIQ